MARSPVICTLRRNSKSLGPSNKDLLASVMELQKTTFHGLMREIVCNDLPTVMLFTDRQLDNIVKFFCHRKANRVSELSVDLTFQLGPFYLLVTSYKNTVLQVKGRNRHPSCIGSVMISRQKKKLPISPLSTVSILRFLDYPNTSMPLNLQLKTRGPVCHLQVEVLNPTTLVIRKSARPNDPSSSSPKRNKGKRP